MGNQLTPEQIDEIVKALQNRGNKGFLGPTSQEVAQERNMLVSNLKRMNGKCFSCVQHYEGFKLGVEVGLLMKNSYPAVRDQAILASRELKKNTEDTHQAPSDSKPTV